MRRWVMVRVSYMLAVKPPIPARERVRGPGGRCGGTLACAPPRQAQGVPWVTVAVLPAPFWVIVEIASVPVWVTVAE